MDYKTLMEEAIQARKSSYCPYSGFMVGAALLCTDGTVIRGCNVENSAYGATNCAERTAFYTAIASGKRSFTAIAIAGGPKGCSVHKLRACYPCGICRQVMAEFCEGQSFDVVVMGEERSVQAIKLKDLLPYAFTLDETTKK